MDLGELRSKLYNKPRKFKVSGSWGTFDAYKLARKHSWYNIGKAVKVHDFHIIVRQVNKLLLERLLSGEVVKFPSRMGAIEVRKYERGAKLVDGKLKINYPVDWDSTLKLWAEDEEAYKNKTLIRFEDKTGYRIKYDRFNATYDNKIFYEFCLHVPAKRLLKDSIKQGKTDTLW